MALGSRPFGRAPLGGTGAAQTVDSSLILQIGPANVTDNLLFATYRVLHELNARDELECSLVSSTSYVPAIGETIVLSYRNGLVFVGTVHEREVQFTSDADSVYTTINVRAVDLNEICDRRRVVEIYENMSAGDIVSQMVLKYLNSSEFIQLGDIQDGPMVDRMVVPYLTVAEVLDELCAKSGFVWNIDTQRTLHFFARTTIPAPFTITSGNAVFRGLQGSRTRNQYRNVQYVDGGHGITDTITDEFAGDGTLRTFHVEYPLYEAPTIQRNFVPQSVGIRGIEEGKQWYWNVGEIAIGQDREQAVLQPTERLLVEYRGRFNLMTIVEDAEAIAERLTVEVGSGRYEQLDRDDALDGQYLVEEKALALLRRFASLDDVIEFEIDIVGLATGQIVSVTVPELGLAGEYLITKMQTEWTMPDRPRFQVTATTGELKGRFQDFFTKLAGASGRVSIREGEILREVSGIHDRAGVTDSIEATLIDVVGDVFGTGEVGPGEMGA